ncbi:MAG TPA: YcaO-like family protein [Bdellovibrionota bacterium]|nr:YcaO-like family protein [Bdellovibrionota bacterium]
MKIRLDEYLNQYPLPPGWSVPENFHEVLAELGTPVHLVGLSIQHQNGRIVTASAAQINTLPIDRAFFELIERISVLEILDKIKSGKNRLHLRTATGTILQEVDAESVFPEDPAPEKSRYSKSNGVAAFSDFSGACDRASLELIERDRLLRSWFGGPAPKRLPDSIHAGWEIRDSLTRYYSSETYLFEDSTSSPDSPQVVGIFCFPKSNDRLFVFGFGSGSSIADALSHAQSECLQRLGFLWDQEMTEAPPFSPTPNYHQELFLGEEGAGKVRCWLDGGNRMKAPSNTTRHKGEFLFVDITPKNLIGKLAVAKAIAPDRLPLIFGHGYEELIPQLSPELFIHPIA